MTREEVTACVKRSIAEIMDISMNEIQTSDSLKDIGANSIDRMDIIVMAMEEAGLKIPMMEFAKLKNIDGIIDVIYSKVQ